MTAKAKELLRQLLELSIEDRNEVLTEVFRVEEESFGPPPRVYEDEAAFDAELQRRLDAVADGTAELIPWDEAREQIRAELARRQAVRDQGDAS